MKFNYLNRLIFFTLLISSPYAISGDAAVLELIGFSNDGKYLAFEQYGITEGSGLAYAEIHFIDVKTNRWAAKPIKNSLADTEEDIPADAVWRGVREQASEQLTRLKIEQDLQGLHVISHTPYDLGAHPHKVRFSTELPLGGKPHITYSLLLDQRETDKDCVGLGKAKLFTLNLVNENSDITKTLQKDTKLPDSRGCPLKYKIQDVYIYKKRLVVFLSLSRPGFEGNNLRYLAITGVLHD